MILVTMWTGKRWISQATPWSRGDYKNEEFYMEITKKGESFHVANYNPSQRSPTECFLIPKEAMHLLMHNYHNWQTECEESNPSDSLHYFHCREWFRDGENYKHSPWDFYIKEIKNA